MNVHDKFRSPCPSCGKKYSDLRQHIRVVHEGAKVMMTYFHIISLGLKPQKCEAKSVFCHILASQHNQISIHQSISDFVSKYQNYLLPFCCCFLGIFSAIFSFAVLCLDAFCFAVFCFELFSLQYSVSYSQYFVLYFHLLKYSVLQY